MGLNGNGGSQVYFIIGNHVQDIPRTIMHVMCLGNRQFYQTKGLLHANEIILKNTCEYMGIMNNENFHSQNKTNHGKSVNIFHAMYCIYIANKCINEI